MTDTEAQRNWDIRIGQARRVEGRSRWDRLALAIDAANAQRDQGQTAGKSAAEEAYSMASEIVLLLIRAISEESDAERRAGLARALVEVHAGEHHIARALRIESTSTSRAPGE